MTPRAISPGAPRLAPTASGNRLISHATTSARIASADPFAGDAPRSTAEAVASRRIAPDGLMSGALTAAVTPDDPKRLQRAATMIVKRSEEHTSELQSHSDLVCRLLLEKKKKKQYEKKQKNIKLNKHIK